MWLTITVTELCWSVDHQLVLSPFLGPDSSFSPHLPFLDLMSLGCPFSPSDSLGHLFSPSDSLHTMRRQHQPPSWRRRANDGELTPIHSQRPPLHDLTTRISWPPVLSLRLPPFHAKATSTKLTTKNQRRWANTDPLTTTTVTWSRDSCLASHCLPKATPT